MPEGQVLQLIHTHKQGIMRNPCLVLLLVARMLPTTACDKKPGKEFIAESTKSREAHKTGSYHGTQANPDAKGEGVSHSFDHKVITGRIHEAHIIPAHCDSAESLWKCSLLEGYRSR